jgi:quinol monooxygenase YgiN
VHSKPEKSDDVLAALAEIIPAARATEGVINFDIARTLDDPDSFIATAVYDDGAALERQESASEVHRAMAIFQESLAAPPERTLFDVSIDPVLV